MQKKTVLSLLLVLLFITFTVLSGELYAQNITSPLPNKTTEGFDWRWLIPLLAVPILFFLFKDNSLNDYPDDRSLSGYKGGQAHRDPMDHQRDFGEGDDEEE